MSEKIDEMKQIPIVEYARRMGFTPIRKGRYYSLREHDSVRIDPVKNCFWRNSGVGQCSSGSVIDFVINFTGVSLSEALRELEEYIGGNPRSFSSDGSTAKKEAEKALWEEQVTELRLPPKGENMKRVFAYLTKTRGLEASVVQDFVKRDMLYQDRKGNCVFVAYEEEKPVFACKRGTLSQIRFMGDVLGSDYTKGFYVGNRGKELYVTESVIDSMSLMSMFDFLGLDHRKYDYQLCRKTPDFSHGDIRHVHRIYASN